MNCRQKGLKMANKEEEKFVESFIKENKKKGIRVFVAGGSRGGNDDIYAKEAYVLGREIIKLGFKLDFGMSNRGIMGAVAKGVIDGWNKVTDFPINAVTTEEYLKLYPADDSLIKEMSSNLIVAKTLEERKQQLLDADFVVFAPGGVGTLDELSYDLVAMQDGFLPMKPFIFYNVGGFFYHLLEYMKEIALKEFADPMPFIVVDNSLELMIAFRLLKSRYKKGKNNKEVYNNVRQLIYELPYFVKEKKNDKILVEDIAERITEINIKGSAQDRIDLANDIESAYLEKEIERMYERMEKAAQSTAVVSAKLSDLKKRKASQV